MKIRNKKSEIKNGRIQLLSSRFLRRYKCTAQFILNSSFLIILQFLLAGCATHARYDNSARLIARADFEAARVAAPEWCRDALKTINELELEIERR